jgi:ATP-dependent RNA helicase CshB
MNRFEVVESFIKHFNPYLLLVFCSTNKEVLELYEFLSAKGHKIGLLTGELESRKRKAMFRRVRNNEFQVVVASDIAARGIDIEHVSDVLSVSFPFDLEFYFHRAGRTGRLDNKGNAYTLYDHDDLETVEKVEKLGVKFTRLVYKGGAFSAVTKRISRKKALTPEEKELNVKIKTAVAETKTKKVRPGYKKKVRTAVENVKRKHRRKMIKKSIREQRVERYKAEKRRDS